MGSVDELTWSPRCAVVKFTGVWFNSNIAHIGINAYCAGSTVQLAPNMTARVNHRGRHMGPLVHIYVITGGGL